MPCDVRRDLVIRLQRAADDEADFVLLQNVGSAVADSCFRTRLGHEFHSEGGTVKVRGLFGVACVEMDVIGSIERQKVGCLRGC
jgi:hypothetical protein